MGKKPFEVFGLGQCCLDYLAKVDSYPSPDTKCEVSDLTVQGGGPVATALTALARWGVSCCFCGVIGDDAFGPVIKDSLEREGINTKRVVVRKGFDSQFAFVLTEPGRGRRTIFWRRPTGAPLRAEELDYQAISQAKVLHIDGLFYEASLAACQIARKAGVRTVIDAGTLREGMLELAKWTDYFIASETFAKALTGNENPEEACYRLRELGPKMVAVTLGDKGYVALIHGALISEPALRVKAVDTTGCGDVFHAGFVFGLLKEWPLRKCLDFANWAAAQVSLKLGGRAGIPSLDAIVRQHFL